VDVHGLSWARAARTPLFGRFHRWHRPHRATADAL